SALPRRRGRLARAGGTALAGAGPRRGRAGGPGGGGGERPLAGASGLRHGDPARHHGPDRPRRRRSGPRRHRRSGPGRRGRGPRAGAAGPVPRLVPPPPAYGLAGAGLAFAAQLAVGVLAQDLPELVIAESVLVPVTVDQVIEQRLYPLHFGHVDQGGLAALPGGLDDQRAAAEQPVHQGLAHGVVVDPVQRDVTPLPPEHAVLQDHSLVGEDIVSGAPDDPRPYRQPQHQDQREAGEHV